MTRFGKPVIVHMNMNYWTKRGLLLIELAVLFMLFDSFPASTEAASESTVFELSKLHAHH
jgi:hypothetical protein